MSAGVSDQRMKGQGNQVNNGPKEQLGAGEGGQGGATGGSSEDFESWRSQQQQQPGQQTHTPYGGSVPISSATDPYSMSTAAGYYGSGGTFPYQAFGVGDGTWSNGTDPMTFLGGYTHDSYSMDGMFGPSTTFSTTAFGQPSAFNYFHGNGDYSTWGNQLNQRKPHYDDYYRTDTQNMYATAQQMQDTNLTLKSVEQGMQNLSIDMTNTGNLHISHNIGGGGPQLAKGDGKDMKNSTTSDGVKDIQPKKMTWASIASQPAKPQVTIQSSGLKKKGPGMPPGPIVPGKHNMDIGTWDTNKSTPPQLPIVNSAPPPPKSATPNVNVRPAWSGPVRTQSGQPQVPQCRPLEPPPQPQTQQPQQAPQHYMTAVPQHHPPPVGMPQMPGPGPLPGPPPQPQSLMMPPPPAPSHPVLDELRVKNNYNPTEFDLSAPGARFFVIKSYSEDDIHRSIKYEIWCSTEHGNKRLDQAYREREKEPNGCVYLFFSVNGSGHFCGMAQMISSVDYHSNSSVWSQDKWKGQFRVRWVYVKDVPNVQLRHIHLENNENKPVTNSRDAQEVPHNKGLQVLRIIHSYRHSTSIFDDFVHYEKRQEEEDNRKVPEPHRDNHHGGGRENYHGGRENHHGGRDGHHGGRDNHHGGRDNYHGNQRDNNPRDGGRDHRGERGGGRNQDRGEPVHDGGHRGGSHRSHDNSHGPKDRSENNSRGGRGRGGGGGRNMN